MSERYLVTGANGAIGSWVCRQLARAGHTVVATDLADDPTRITALDPDLLAQLEYHSVDLLGDRAVESVLERAEVTRIIHLAGLQLPFVAADPALGARVNVELSVRLFAAASSLPAVRGVSFASSGAVRGASDDKPGSLYGVMKRAIEEVADFFHRTAGLPATGLRPNVVYGPGRDQGLTSAITQAVRAAARGESYTVPFTGMVDLQYGRDVAEAFIAAAAHDGHRGLTYDLSGTLIEVGDALELVRTLQPDARLDATGDPIPSKEDNDDAAFVALVGPLSKTPLRTGLADTLEFYRGSGTVRA